MSSYRGHYAICDVCGFKYRASDLIVVTNKDSTQYGLLVCKHDLDKVNQQIYVTGARPQKSLNPARVRPGGADVARFASTASEIESPSASLPAGDAPEAPQRLVAFPDMDGYVQLEWEIRGSIGSSGIRGYKIERESPIGGGFSTIVANSNSAAQMYVDKTIVADTTYNYRISAINYHGTSSVSNEAYTTT